MPPPPLCVAWAWAICPPPAAAEFEFTLLEEDFDGVALRPSVNERQSTVLNIVTVVADAPDTESVQNAFTPSPPIGWTVDNDYDGFGQGVIIGNAGRRQSRQL